ncbi:MAG TPA: hypothetical protein VFN36_00245 [Solirubrobacteraceae bacterium]|nr:hypothetical protein [Solirubrobacteraceae bacterium]
MPSARRTLALAVIVVTVLAVSASADTAAGRRARAGGGVELSAAKVSGLGLLLVRGTGHVLYVFQPLSTHVVCGRSCERVWPPLLAPARGRPRATGGARQVLIGTARDPVTGRRIVTYAGRPLHTYVLDTQPHEAAGQNVMLDSGYWWVLTPAGRIVRTPVSHGGGYVGS